MPLRRAFTSTFNIQVLFHLLCSGSLAGDQVIVVNGRGFDDSVVISLCDEPCVTSTSDPVTPTTYTCKTPANQGSGDVMCDVTATASSVTQTLSDAYTYRGSLTASVTGVNPKRGGTGGGTRITVTGSGFG